MPAPRTTTPGSTRVPAIAPPLEVVYRRHVGFVWRTLRRLGVPDADLEDATHEVFLVVQRRLPDYDGRALVTTWLHGLARNVARNRQRALVRMLHRLRGLAAPPGEPLAPDLGVARREAAAVLEGFLAGLDPSQREVFELAEIEQLQGPEIAELLQVNVNTVYTRLRSARKRFAELLGDDVAMEGVGHGR